ncbi:MAG: M12 family metallo-peptidase [Bacteroidota bacterium]
MKFPIHLLSGLLCLLLSQSLLAQLQTKPKQAHSAETIVQHYAATDLIRPLNHGGRSAPVDHRLINYHLLQLDEEQLSQLRTMAPKTLRLAVPLAPGHRSGRRELQLDLTRVNPLANGFLLRTASGQTYTNVELGVHYRGKISGEKDAHVALSLLPDGIQALIARPGGHNEVLGPLTDQSQLANPGYTAYVLYDDAPVFEHQALDCATADSGVPYNPTELRFPASTARSTDGCVNVYFEVDHDIYLDKGGTTNAAAYVTAAFNEVAALYAAINVDVAISEIFVWDQFSPYGGSSSSTLLNQFQGNRSSFNGDIAQLLSYKASGGIAVLDGLCHPFTAARMSFSSIHSSFHSVPTYSWTIMVIAHELGHLLGSQHTHACVWNSNNTAIDGCAGFTEGSCGNPGLPTSGHGSIMSYCHITPIGIDFTEGLGVQPGAVIFNRVNNAPCLNSTTCGHQPPPPPPPPPGGGNNDSTQINCEAHQAYLRITLDLFGMETTWTVESEDQEVIASGGPYEKKQLGRTITDTICLEDGCYNLRIYDADGDGLCCAYGTGSYQLVDTENNVLALGSEFDSVDVKDFCLPYVEPRNDSTNCAAMDFLTTSIISYGMNQDVGTSVVSENGQQLLIANNAWKAVAIDYSITSNTVLEFDFKSTIEGEIHGIGMDDDMHISPTYTFQLYGTQSWGVNDFNDYPGNGQWKTYRIPIGEFMTGQANYLFFAADHDVGTRNGNSFFRRVRIHEGEACEEVPLPPEGDLIAPQKTGLRIWPNPTTDQLQFTTELPGSYRIVSAMGQVVQRGEFTESGLQQLTTDELSSGTYFLFVQHSAGETSQRFTKH